MLNFTVESLIYENGVSVMHNNTRVDNFDNGTFRSNETLDYELICLQNFTVFHLCVYFMYSAIFIIALLGNGLVCFVVQTSPRMKTVTNYFIVNLAVGDIMLTVFCIPFSFVSTLVLHYWPFGALMCRLVNFSQAVSVLVSAYTLLAISIDRYIAIMRPFKPRLGKTSAKLVVATVWIGALATAMPIPIVSELQRPSYWHEYCEADFCQEQWLYPEQSEHYTYALLMLQFALPLGALVGTYARIALAVWGGRPPGEAQDARDSRLQKSKTKMIKMMVTVVAVFIICWLPLNIFIVLYTIHSEDADWGSWPGLPYVWFASHWLAMSHSCYNPIIYCYMNAKYRRGFQQALSNLVCLRLCLPTRWYRRTSSMCDGVLMSDMAGANGTARRCCTTSSGLHRLQRAPTCSSCASVRRPTATITVTIPATTAPTNTVARSRQSAPAPVRALSLRTRFT